MQSDRFYIRGAWRTISDRQPAHRQQAGPASERDGRQQGQTLSSNASKSSNFQGRNTKHAVSGGNELVVRRELSQEMKESSAFLRNTESDWEAVLRRMSARDGEDQVESEGSREETAMDSSAESQEQSQGSFASSAFDTSQRTL